MRRTINPVRRVALFDLGEKLRIKLPVLGSKLNRLQDSFEFSVIEPITLQRLGAPDDDPYYDVKRLHEEIERHFQRPKYDFLIGVTHLKMTVLEENVKAAERAYFSLSNLKGVGVISTHGDILDFKPLLKNEYQYVAYLVMCEVLINLAGEDLCHPDYLDCLFDDCEDRKALRDCIEKGKICDVLCRPKLKKNSVSDQVIHDVQTVLNWCKKNSLAITIRHFLNNTWVVALLGGVLTAALIWLIIFVVTFIRQHP